jgi:uncharacterized protein YbgA (DUF1722 family)
MTKLVDKKWNKQYEKLVEFKQKNGHCLVPNKYQEDASFGKWVDKQRQSHSNNTIRLARKGLLDEIGFVWRLRVVNSAPSWQQQYEKLVEFKRKNGNCLVPRRYEEDDALGKWVSNQRHCHSKNTIQRYRKDLLDKIEFVWRVANSAPSSWNQQYEKLVEFKQKNGHCLVPNKYQEDASFGSWVSWQRGRHANNKILPDRKKLLDEIGFVWKAGTVAARSSSTNVRDLIIASVHALFRICFSLSRSCSAFNLCGRMRIRKRPPAVWVLQTKH